MLTVVNSHRRLLSMQTLLDAFVSLVEEGRTYVFLLPIYVSLLAGERIAHALWSKRPWNDRDGAANLSITIAYLGVELVVGKIVPVAAMAWLYEHARLFALGNAWHGWLIAFLLHDLTWYVDHRLGHRTGLFWATHHVHHSSEEFNTTVASRGFIFDNTVARPMYFLLPLLGMSPFQFVAMRIFVSVWGIAQHTRLVPRLGWLDWWFATPSSHRVHHGSNDKYIDKNYGEVLMIWDHLFGTYQAEEEEPVFGVTEPIGTHNPIKIQVAGIAGLLQRMSSASRIADKLRYLIKPPEWSHEPSRNTTSGPRCPPWLEIATR